MFKKKNPTRDAIFVILLLSLCHKVLGDKRPAVSQAADLTPSAPVQRTTEDPDRIIFFSHLETCDEYLAQLVTRTKGLPPSPASQELGTRIASTQETVRTMREHGYQQDSPAMALLGPLATLSKRIQRHQLTSVAYDLHDCATRLYEVVTGTQAPPTQHWPDFEGVLQDVQRLLNLTPTADHQPGPEQTPHQALPPS